jgi:hypothetical protein
MPLAKLTCPECKAVLKPAKPVQEGKTVKCPKCEASFTAGGDDAAPASKEKAKATTTESEEESGGIYGVVETDADKKKKDSPKKKRRRSDDDDEDDGDDEQPEESDPVKELLRNLKAADPRGPAQEIIVKPSNWLMRIGGVGFFSWVGCFIVFLIPIIFPPPPDKPDENAVAPVEKKEEKKAGEQPPGPSMKVIAGRTLWRVIFLTCFFFPGIIQGGLIAYGAAKVQSMESRGWGIAAAIIAIFPLHSLPIFWLSMFLFALLAIFLDMVAVWGLVPPLFFLAWGPAYGIWSLIQFLKPEVKLGFEYKPKD